MYFNIVSMGNILFQNWNIELSELAVFELSVSDL